MKIFFSILLCCLIFPWVSVALVGEQKGAFVKEGLRAESVEKDKGSPEQKEKKSSKAIEDYEKEKLAKYKRHIGKRFLALQTVRPPEFYESPNDLKKKIKFKEKEEFQVMEVVQNQSGTMNFYKVRLEGGKIGYLGADGNNLEIRTKDGSLIPVTPKLGKRTGTFRAQASRAIDLVKSQLIPSDPVSKDKRSVERRMLETRATTHPKLKWRYEAKEIGNNRYRVTQIAEGESDRAIFRTWVVDLSTRKVTPENQAAKDLYRYQGSSEGWKPQRSAIAIRIFLQRVESILPFLQSQLASISVRVNLNHETCLGQCDKVRVMKPVLAGVAVPRCCNATV